MYNCCYFHAVLTHPEDYSQEHIRSKGLFRNWVIFQKYFKEKLGYGYKCPKCKTSSGITFIGINFNFSFWCTHCRKGWNFQVPEKELLRKI